jgi:hypothetical protein
MFTYLIIWKKGDEGLRKAILNSKEPLSHDMVRVKFHTHMRNRGVRNITVIGIMDMEFNEEGFFIL